jgi:hypothetical protein
MILRIDTVSPSSHIQTTTLEFHWGIPENPLVRPEKGKEGREGNVGEAHPGESSDGGQRLACVFESNHGYDLRYGRDIMMR